MSNNYYYRGNNRLSDYGPDNRERRDLPAGAFWAHPSRAYMLKVGQETRETEAFRVIEITLNDTGEKMFYAVQTGKYYARWDRGVNYRLSGNPSARAIYALSTFDSAQDQALNRRRSVYFSSLDAYQKASKEEEEKVASWDAARCAAEEKKEEKFEPFFAQAQAIIDKEIQKGNKYVTFWISGPPVFESTPSGGVEYTRNSLKKIAEYLFKASERG